MPSIAAALNTVTESGDSELTYSDTRWSVLRPPSGSSRYGEGEPANRQMYTLTYSIIDTAGAAFDD